MPYLCPECGGRPQQAVLKGNLVQAQDCSRSCKVFLKGTALFIKNDGQSVTVNTI